jgi:hypothetical protein
MAYYELDDVFGYQDANEIKKLWASVTAPVEPGDGEVWLDTSLTPNRLKRYTANVWETIGDMTADDLLNLLKTIDGSGSGLDADTLDGKEADDFIQYSSNGKVGIGTSDPTYVVEIVRTGENAQIVTNRSDGATTILAATNGAGFFGTMNEYDLRLSTNDTTKMIIDTAGNVGIGTTTPTVKLDVNGDTNVSGNLIVNNDISIQNDGTHSYIQNSADNSSDLYIQNKSHGEKIILTGEDSSGTEQNLLTLDPETGNPSAQGNIIWHEGNDGSGSGLDADTLDGQEGSFYQNADNITSGSVARARLSELANVNSPYICGGKAYIGDNEWVTIPFGGAYSSTPVVVASQDEAKIIRIAVVSTTGFQAQRLLQKSEGGGHVAGFIYWISFGNRY